jgi:hypothetical protein
MQKRRLGGQGLEVSATPTTASRFPTAKPFEYFPIPVRDTRTVDLPPREDGYKDEAPSVEAIANERCNNGTPKPRRASLLWLSRSTAFSSSPIW